MEALRKAPDPWFCSNSIISRPSAYRPRTPNKSASGLRGARARARARPGPGPGPRAPRAPPGPPRAPQGQGQGQGRGQGQGQGPGQGQAQGPREPFSPFWKTNFQKNVKNTGMSTFRVKTKVVRTEILHILMGLRARGDNYNAVSRTFNVLTKFRCWDLQPRC